MEQVQHSSGEAFGGPIEQLNRLEEEVRKSRAALDATKTAFESEMANGRASLLRRWGAVQGRIEGMVAEFDADQRKWEKRLARRTKQWRSAHARGRRELQDLRLELKRLQARQRRRSRRGLFGWLRR